MQERGRKIAGSSPCRQDRADLWQGCIIHQNGSQMQASRSGGRLNASKSCTAPSAPAIAPAAVAKIPGARLVRLDGVGHAPQVEAPDRFHEALLAAIG